MTDQSEGAWIVRVNLLPGGKVVTFSKYFSAPYNRVRGAITILFVLLWFHPGVTTAEPASGVDLTHPARHMWSTADHSFHLDGHEYWIDVLTYDFLQIAFPQHLWLEDTLDPAHSLYGAHSTPARERFPYTWASEYIFRDHGYPRSDVLNRWSTDITVAVGWPPLAPPAENAWDTERAAYEDRGRASLEVHTLRQRTLNLAQSLGEKAGVHLNVLDPTETAIKNQIQALAPQILAATGLHLRFIDPADETPSNYAHVRIITNTSFFLNNKFKIERDGHSSVIKETRGMPNFDTYLRGAVAFTPFARAQVEGYFVSDMNNSIDFAVCKLWPHFREDLLKSLVTECVARSLGLPEMSVVSDSAAIGHWNKAHDSDSKRVLLDGLSSNPSADELAIQSITGDSDESQRAAAQQRAEEQVMHFPNDLTDPAAMITQLKEYDLAMLSLLYCKDLSPAMDRAQVTRVLYRTLYSCLATFKKDK